ncbi:diguanylate cyclase/phosphodiesterase [Persephonella hydrogeniphila]|uniref:Diguanylate cyclase/phosphodiesterase n=1 Tax=Persephonella hydrogeniphila TaxID=198703 RepID=A0A285NF76_9AQUI|nr:GGDEF and EAL domain-containing protein [Persephonella hydrogeniphila]SNZ08164.1 diguanylate cyclase/phosphodiesterase [Persephonella hydrogeniphila]
MTLRKFLIIYLSLMVLVVLPFLYLSIMKVHQNIIYKKTKTDTELIAKQTFNAMFQIMKKGWQRKDLLDFLKSIRKDLQNSPYTLDIYRTQKVEKIFGKVEQPPFTEDVLTAIKQKRQQITEKSGKIEYIFPVIAKDVCIKCHTNAQSGDVLGAIRVSADVQSIISETKKDFSKTLLSIITIPLSIALILGIYLTKRVRTGIDKLYKEIQKISTMKDLEKIRKEKFSFPIQEFNLIFEGIKKIVDKMSNIAVDKEILEMEIALLEKFIITSDVIKNWKDYINLLLKEINQVMRIYTIFSVFKIGDNLFEIELFWYFYPEEKMKKDMEKLIKEKLVETFSVDYEEITLHINHNVSSKEACVIRSVFKDIKLQTKSLILERPSIGGIIGVGVGSDSLSDKTKILVIESILSTLLNVVGSIKAIYRYTKDLEYYATRDPLTNLYNQRVFWELINYEVKRASTHKYKFSLLVIDLDNFKAINDSYGHKFGDKFLIEVANLLEQSIKPGDIVARYGGDEFVIVLPETDAEKAKIVAKRIVETANSFYINTPDGKKINPQFSVGIATFPDNADNEKDLFTIADSMMYKAKMSGKGHVRFPTESDMQEIIKKEQEINLLLIDSINKGNVIPVFQPIINNKTGDIFAYEVLSRLRINNRLIPASKFIEVAEKTGLIHKMDLISIEKALKYLKDSNKKIFINLNPKSFTIQDFFKNIRSIMEKYRIRTERIVFEITERDTVKNFSLLQNLINEQKEHGFYFAIDDFGSGFSSFYYLKQLPIDFIKIEGEFIRNITLDEKDKAFVESIIILAKKLNIKIIAEYVESEEILEMVKELGIEYAQGYYIGKPNIKVDI